VCHGRANTVQVHGVFIRQKLDFGPGWLGTKIGPVGLGWGVDGFDDIVVGETALPVTVHLRSLDVDVWQQLARLHWQLMTAQSRLQFAWQT